MSLNGFVAFRVLVVVVDLLCVPAFIPNELSWLMWPSFRGAAQYVGFLGDRVNYNGSWPGKRYAGMLGLRFSGPPQISIPIYGYTPDTHLLNDKEALVTALLEGQNFPGQVLDHFDDYIDATNSPHGYIFVFWDILGPDCADPDCGRSQVLRDVELTGKPNIGKTYGFPPWVPREYKKKEYSACDGTWGQTCFHAGTYPASVGLPVPEEAKNAMFTDFMVAMASSEGAFCRCYKSGDWRPSEECDSEREKQVFDKCFFDDPSTEADELPPLNKLIREPNAPAREL